jgi:hypothetical protein
VTGARPPYSKALIRSTDFTRRTVATDPAGIERIAKKYGIEILGPPLA